MGKKKVILTSLASAAVLGAGVFVSQPSVVKADGGKVEEQAATPTQPQTAPEGESGDQTEKGLENASPANPEATSLAKMTKEELMQALDELEEQAISDIEYKEAIEDKEAAVKAVKEYIGKLYISDTLESGELSLDNIIAELPEGAEDKPVVTGPEAKTNKQLSAEEVALLDQAEKDAREQVSQAIGALLQAIEDLENSVIEEIKKDTSIIDKEAAIKAAKEEIGKEDLLKAIADEDLEIGDVIVDWPADTSEHKTEAEPVSEFTDEDQAKLDEADKEAQVEAAKVRSDLLATLEKIEQETIDDLNKDASITDKEAAIKAAKEVIGKDAVLKAIEEGDLDASDLLADLLAGESDQVTPAEAKTQSQFSNQVQAKLAAADKEAAEETKAHSELLTTLESIEQSTIEDINKDASITDKEAAIKAAKEVIGKDAILKAIEDGDIEASDLLADFLAEESDQVTPAEAKTHSQLSSQDQAKLTAADKEAAEEAKKAEEARKAEEAKRPETNTKKQELLKLEKKVIKIKEQISISKMNGVENNQVKELQQALADYEDAIKTLSSVMSAVLEIEDFKGGVNAVEAATTELPEYKQGVNAVEAAVNELPVYAESGAPAVVNVPVYAESGAPAVANVPVYAESGAPAVANVPVYAESGAPAVANVPVYAESGAPAVVNVPVYAESGAPAVANIPAYAEKIEPAVNDVPEYTGSAVPLDTNSTLGTKQDRTYKAPAATDEQLLPNTGSQATSAVGSLGFIGLLLGLLPFAKRRLNK